MLKNKEKLMVGIIVLVVTVILVTFFVLIKNKIGDNNSRSTDVPVLEEFVEQEGKNLDNFVPPLEELGIENKNLEQVQESPVPQPTNVSPLEEL